LIFAEEPELVGYVAGKGDQRLAQLQDVAFTNGRLSFRFPTEAASPVAALDWNEQKQSFTGAWIGISALMPSLALNRCD